MKKPVLLIASLAFLCALFFSSTKESGASSDFVTIQKDTSLYDTKDWAYTKAEYDKAQIKSILNGNFWIATNNGYYRKSNKSANIKFVSKDKQFAPSVDFNFKKLYGVGTYKVGSCYGDSCVSCIVKMAGAGLAADDTKSVFRITSFDENTGLISGTFELYLDPNVPKINQKSSFRKKLEFKKGSFKNIKINVY